MPRGDRVLAPVADNAYILRMKAPKVKPEKLPESGRFRPMILSMTGFAAVAAELPGVALAVELRSVNHRYLDLQVRLPDELRALEAALRERFSRELKRGKVECRISLARVGGRAPRRSPSIWRASRQLATARRRSDAQRARARGRCRSARSCAGPASCAEPTVAPEELAAHARRLVGEALAELVGVARARRREARGHAARALRRASRRRSRASRRAFRRSRPRTPRSSARACAKPGSTPNDERLKQELALFATKVDVAEELSRLGARTSPKSAACSRRAAAPASASTS